MTREEAHDSFGYTECCEEVISVIDQIYDDFEKDTPKVEKKYTGLDDKKGNKIHEGDIVRFYFSANDEIDMMIKRATGNYNDTEMIDIVEIIDGKPFFTCLTTGGGARASRYNKICEIIGSIYNSKR